VILRLHQRRHRSRARQAHRRMAAAAPPTVTESGTSFMLNPWNGVGTGPASGR
jgi:hypothetical protein